MNRVHTTLAITSLAAIVVGWHLWPADPPDSQPSSLSASGISTDPEPSPAEPAPIQPTIPIIEPAPIAALEETSEAMTKLLEQNGCIVSELRLDPETAELRDVYTCPPAEHEPSTGPAHPYESWSNETLASMAYGDPKAAEVLGLRHVVSPDLNEEALGLSLLYRSAALSGDPAVFHQAIGRRYAYLSVNGEPQLHNLRQLLIFSLIGEQLGGERFDALPVEDFLRRSSTAAEEIAALHQTAEQILRTMAQVQTDVTGNTSIAEAIADA